MKLKLNLQDIKKGVVLSSINKTTQAFISKVVNSSTSLIEKNGGYYRCSISQSALDLFKENLESIKYEINNSVDGLQLVESIDRTTCVLTLPKKVFEVYKFTPEQKEKIVNVKEFLTYLNSS